MVAAWYQRIFSQLGSISANSCAVIPVSRVSARRDYNLVNWTFGVEFKYTKSPQQFCKNKKQKTKRLRANIECFNSKIIIHKTLNLYTKQYVELNLNKFHFWTGIAGSTSSPGPSAWEAPDSHAEGPGDEVGLWYGSNGILLNRLQTMLGVRRTALSCFWLRLEIISHHTTFTQFRLVAC